MRSALTFVLLPVLACAAACGNSVDVEDGGSGGSAATNGSSTVATATAATTTGPTATSTGASSSDGGSGPSGTGGSGDGGGVTGPGAGGADVTTGEGGAGEGGVGPGPGAGGSSSSGTEPFVCGEEECADDEYCCGSQQGVACVGADDPCQGATLTCQGASNCDNGQICCLQGDFQNAESVCADECEPTQAGPIQLCESEEECVEDVPCQEVFGGFKVCSNGFPG